MALELTHAERLSSDLLQRINNGELLAVLQDQLENSEPLHWPYALKLRFAAQQQFSQIDQAYWDQAAAAILTPDNILEKAKPLMKENFIREAIETPEFQADLKDLVTTILQEKKMGD